MSMASASSAGLPLWAVRRGSWFLAVLVTAAAAIPVVAAIGDLDRGAFPAPPPRSQNALGAGCAGSAIWLLQMRHSLAAARRVRPRGWPLSLAALVALAAVPPYWFSVNWISALWFPLAAAAMVLRARATAAVVAASLVAMGVVAAWTTVGEGAGAAVVVVAITFNVVFFGVGVGSLYWSALLVKQIHDLYASRIELAQAAVTGERRRMSRDLHDQLGQQLSAISLKGDLAVRLLSTRRDAALREVEEITEVARRAVRDMQAIARARHEVSMTEELDSAVALLEAAGLAVHTRVELPRLGAAENALFAWAVREAATNVLRHSEAQRCWISAFAENGCLRLEIVNDGVRRDEPPGNGSGLNGLSQRAREQNGVVRRERSRGRFALRVDVPVGQGVA